MRADLHLHSTASDGLMAPAALLEACKQAELNLVALTDHDTLAGVPEALERATELGIELIPGVEMGLDDTLQIHLLGYGTQAGFAALSPFLTQMRGARERRARAILEKLERLGVSLPYEAVRDIAPGVISRAHIARALVSAKAAGSFSLAFAKYLSPGKPAFVPRETVEMPEALRLLKACGAVPVLAHPGRMRMQEAQAKACILEWHEMGLAGLEVYHSSHTPTQIRFFRDVAAYAGLICTGGSDFHGHPEDRVRIGQMADIWRDATQHLKCLQERLV